MRIISRTPISVPLCKHLCAGYFFIRIIDTHYMMHKGERVCMRKLKGNPDTFDITGFLRDLGRLRALPVGSQPLLLPEYVISVIILAEYELISTVLICFASLFLLIFLQVGTTETYTIQWRARLRLISSYIIQLIDYDFVSARVVQMFSVKLRTYLFLFCRSIPQKSSS